jgi:hypothetical protein
MIRENVKVELLGKLANMNERVSEEGCQTCSKEYPLHFKDLLSYREFKLSGMCQKCQDEVFTEVDHAQI